MTDEWAGALQTICRRDQRNQPGPDAAVPLHASVSKCVVTVGKKQMSTITGPASVVVLGLAGREERHFTGRNFPASQ